MTVLIKSIWCLRSCWQCFFITKTAEMKAFSGFDRNHSIQIYTVFVILLLAAVFGADLQQSVCKQSVKTGHSNLWRQWCLAFVFISCHFHCCWRSWTILCSMTDPSSLPKRWIVKYFLGVWRNWKVFILSLSSSKSVTVCLPLQSLQPLFTIVMKSGLKFFW